MASDLATIYERGFPHLTDEHLVKTGAVVGFACRTCGDGEYAQSYLEAHALIWHRQTCPHFTIKIGMVARFKDNQWPLYLEWCRETKRGNRKVQPTLFVIKELDGQVARVVAQGVAGKSFEIPLVYLEYVRG